MKVLFIGGTGNISKACAELAIARGYDVTLLNRGKKQRRARRSPNYADMSDTAAVSSALGAERWDVVADFITFTPEQLEQRLGLFRGRIGQFISISSASAYQKTRHALSHHRIHAARQSILGLFAQQNRLRRSPAARAA